MADAFGRAAWEWHVLRKAAWLQREQTLPKKEGSFVHDGWRPLPLFVSYGIGILKGNWGDVSYAGVSNLCLVKGSLFGFILRGIGSYYPAGLS